MPENPASRPILTAEQINAFRPPPWLATWRASLQNGADGRPYYHTEIDGCDVYAIPKAWRDFTLPPEGNSMSRYPLTGVDIQDVHRQNPGTIIVTPASPPLSTSTEVPRSIVTPEVSALDGWETHILIAAIIGVVGCVILGGILAVTASVWGWRKYVNA